MKHHSFTLAGATHRDPAFQLSIEKKGGMPKCQRKNAFTLAEVLITLGIIGIVAAMTISSVVSNYKERQTVVRLKHTYSLLDQAVRKTIAEHGELNQWSDESKEFFEQELTKHLKVIGEQNCPYSIWSQGLCSNIPNATHKYVLNNGVVLGVTGRRVTNPPDNNSHRCYISMNQALHGGDIHYGSCAYVWVDLNGRSKPNEKGKDTFEFRVYTDGVLPKGISERNSNDGFDKCFDGSGLDNGTNCTGWIIYNENMDYLKCRDKLHWDGPHSCKEANKKN